jgi:phosphate ABC transporter phosphate-binding protein
MPIFPLKPVVALAGCLLPGWAFAGQGTQSGARRLYVEPFTTKGDTQKLREDVTKELRKLHSVSLVPNESEADLVLGGGGEIWIRGYRSFSPRSEMKLRTNGVPLYGGFLSVELKNKSGVTLWSYLATPATASEDIAKDLSKQIAKHLAGALDAADLSAPKSSGQHSDVALKGAGATFPYPVYQKWFTNFQVENPGTAISYDPIGSEAGIRQLLAETIDFGATDSPEAIDELAPGEEGKYLLFPSVAGAVVPIVNVPGVPEAIAFTPEALAGIFLGKITKWNDPILKRANPGLRLPDLDIVVVHRADGSGTSYAWTDYLSKTNPAWKSAVGSSLNPKWPIGRGATGNEGVAGAVKELGGSIGYVEFIYALQHHLSYGKIRNRNGQYMEASLESIRAAVSHSAAIHDDLKGSVVDAPGDGAYPVATFTWIAVPAHIADDKKRSGMIAFLRWMLGPGQKQAAALGYLALPAEIVVKEEDAIGRIH